MIAQLPSLANDPSALIVGVLLIGGSVIGSIAYALGVARGRRDETERLESWQRRRP